VRPTDSFGTEHVTATVVAVLIGLTTLWYGGNPPEVSAAISLLVWWAVALGLTGGILPRSPIARPALVAAGLFLLLAALTGVSFFWSNNEGLAFIKAIQWFLLGGVFVLALLVAVPGTARGWFGGITLGLGFIIVVGMLGRYFPGISDDAELARTLYGAAGRLSWPLGYWNAMAAAGALAAVGAIWFGANHPGRRWRALGFGFTPICFLALYLTSSRGAVIALIVGMALLFWMEPRRRRLAFAFGAGLAGGGILILIASRMHDLVHAKTGGSAGTEGLILLACTVVVVGASLWTRGHFEDRARNLRIKRPRPLVWALLGVALLVAVVASNPVEQVRTFVETPKLSEARTEDNQTTYHLLSASGNGRWQYWSAAFGGFKDEPLTGIGAGSFRDYYDHHRDTLLFGSHAHSLPLEILGEQGLAGFVLAAGFLGVVVGITRRRWKTRPAAGDADPGPYDYELFPPLVALVATGLVSFSLDWSSEFPALSAPVLLAMAVLVGPAMLRRGTGPEPVPTAFDPRPSGLSAPRLASAIGLIAVAGVVIYLSGLGFGSALYTEKSREAIKDEEYSKAIEYGEKAVAFAPWSSEATLQLAAGQELGGDLPGALNTLDDTVEQAPLDGAPWLARFRIYVKLQDLEHAYEAYAKAQELDPNAPFFQPADFFLPAD